MQFSTITVDIEATKSSNVYNTHTDHLGSSSILTAGLSFDGIVTATTGTITQQLDSFPYGEERLNLKTGLHDTPKKYTGKELDEETGLYYYGARYYDARLGRFVSEDPVARDTSDIRLLIEPQRWNSFSYALNNPVKYVDPDGRYALVDDLIAMGVGAAVGVIGQGISDLAQWEYSGWENYVGAAVGGAAGGEAALYVGPVAGGAIGGAATSAAQQGLRTAAGKNEEFSVKQVGVSALTGAATGLIPAPKIKGVTAGKGSFSAVGKQAMTNLENGNIENVSAATFGKITIAKTVEDSPGIVFDTAKNMGVKVLSPPVSKSQKPIFPSSNIGIAPASSCNNNCITVAPVNPKTENNISF